MAFDINSLQNLGLPEMVIWLLSFAIVYGVLSQVKMPKSAASRLIISIVLAFFVLFSAPVSIVQTLTGISSNLILVVMALLILLVFLEVFGVRIKEKVPVLDKKGKPIPDLPPQDIEYTVFEKYGYLFFFAFIIIAALIFVNANGLQTLGLKINLSPFATTTTVFFILIILAVIWMFIESKKK